MKGIETPKALDKRLGVKPAKRPLPRNEGD